ncbi:hypothetical protein LPJ70_005118 [Coemansia sp. RSA 2708]|nr:hypothetical protein LPJ70_005118 [Coemansia sp. RSA 2708]
MVTMAAMLMLAASVLLTGIPPPANDRIYVKTHRELDAANYTRPIGQIIVFGDAGRETDDQRRAKLCGGNLWIDHLAEALGADLISYAHGYAIRSTVIDRIRGYTRIERVKSPIGHGGIAPIYRQAEKVARFMAESPDKPTLFVLVVDPAQRAAGSSELQLTALATAANKLILDSGIRAHRFLIIDTPMPRRTDIQQTSLSAELAGMLVHDPSVEIDAYDAPAFLQRMQLEFYKYGLRHPNRACIVHERTRRCTKPDRFFWCDNSHVGNKAHFFMADDIIKNYFMASVAAA